MIADQDLWACAIAVIKNHADEGVGSYILSQILRLIDAEESEGRDVWFAIADRVLELEGIAGRLVH